MKAEAVYKGIRASNGVLVTIDGKELPMRLDLRNHSPTGFEWGYAGSGPAQLALAIMADFTDDETALNLYQRFKEDIICSLGSSNWEIKAPTLHEWVRQALKKHKRESQGHFI